MSKEILKIQELIRLGSAFNRIMSEARGRKPEGEIIKQITDLLAQNPRLLGILPHNKNGSDGKDS